MDDARAVGSRPRRVVGAMLAVALLALALVSWQLGSRPAQTAGPGTSGDPSASLTAPPQPTAAPRPSGTPEPTGPAGPGITEPGILLTVTLVGNDALAVREQVKLADPTTTLTLRPVDLERLSSDFDDHTASAEGVELTAGGQPLVVPDGQVTAEVQLTLPAPVTDYTLTYQLDDTVVQTLPSTTGRGLGAVAPLTADVADDLPVRLYATGSSVINLYCPTRTNIDEQACASGDRPRLHTNGTLPWRDAIVVLQLDLQRRR